MDVANDTSPSSAWVTAPCQFQLPGTPSDTSFVPAVPYDTEPTYALQEYDRFLDTRLGWTLDVDQMVLQETNNCFQTFQCFP